ncbi:MAG: TetR/AcrR family transcriptional regulator, partial [Holophagales bacterium]|nr:TetR/AcrR family transcriptional regulator [Holophagales bacterium]
MSEPVRSRPLSGATPSPSRPVPRPSSGATGELSKGERTRLDILHKALQMSTTVGLEGLSIGSVAKAVGMSKSGLFAHFDSKEDLQMQVLDTGVGHWIRKVAAPAMKEPRGEPRVRAIFDAWLQWERATFLPGGCPFIAAAVELDSRPGPLRDHLKKIQLDALDALATSARLAVGEDHFRADLDLQQFAHDFYSIILGYHHFTRLLDDERAGDRACQAFEELLAR